MASGLYFPISAIPFSLLVIMLFFIKDTIKTTETKIYKYLLLSNFIGLIIEIFCTYASMIRITNPLLSDFILKLYLVYNIFWTLLLTFYVFYVSFSDKYIHNKEKYRILVLILFIISTFFTYLLRCDLIIKDNFRIRYTEGPSVNFTYSICGLLIFCIVLMLIINRKNIKSKRFIPIYVFIVTLIIGIIIQKLIPGLLIMTYIETITVSIMYFTIENPDLKLVRQMEYAKNQAEKASKAKSDFLSSMSHEIRTPLNAIIGLSEDNMNYKDEVPNEVYENSKDIVNASNTLLEIVGNILDINKIESNKMDLVEEKYMIRKLIDNLIRINNPKVEEKGLELVIDIDDNIPNELIGDREHIREIINNLLTNAIKYTEKGKVTLNIKCSNQNDICHLTISVKDTGRGIKKEDIDKLFTKFNRLERDLDSTIEGTGLGLAITKHLVDMMNGKIKVDSKYGVGSEFIVQLDQKIDNSKEQVEDKIIITEPEGNTDFGNKKILIVDDNKLNIKVAIRALKDFNFTIDECYDGSECLDKVKKGNEYDLILMDIMMPNMNGEETIKKLKENKDFNIPTIAVTADAIAGAEEKYKNEGFVDYISKPFTKIQIQEKLSNVFKNDI